MKDFRRSNIPLALTINLLMSLLYACNMEEVKDKTKRSGFSLPVEIKTLSDSSVKVEELVAVEIQPAQFTLAVGTSASFSVKAIFKDGGSRDITKTSSYRLKDSGIVDIHPSKLTGRRVGRTEIVAEFNNFKAIADVKVTPAVATSLVMEVAERNLLVGLSTDLSLMALMSDGSKQPVTHHASYKIQGNDEIELWALDKDAAQTLINSEGSSAEAPVNSGEGNTTNEQNTDSPSVKRLTKEEAIQRGLLTAENQNIAKIKALKKGKVLITAYYQNKETSLEMQVIEASLLSISLKSNPDGPFVKGQSIELVVKGVYSDGQERDLSKEATFQVQNTAIIAPIEGHPQKFSATQVGSTSVKARVQGKEASLNLTVGPAKLISITLNSHKSELMVGEIINLKVFGTYSDDTVVDITQHANLVFTSSNNKAIPVSNLTGQKGRLTAAIVISQATVSVSFPGVNPPTPLTFSVVPDAITKIEINPVSVSVAAGLSTQLTAIGYRTINQTPVDITQSVVWSLSKTGIAQIGNGTNLAGRVTGISVGTVEAKAIYSGQIQSSPVNVTVLAPKISRIDITPLLPVVRVNKMMALQATLVYSDGSKMENAAELLEWTSVDPLRALVNNNPGSRGQISGVLPGTVVINARLVANNLIGQISVEVLATEFSYEKVSMDSESVQESIVNLIIAVDDSASMAQHQANLAEKIDLALSSSFSNDKQRVIFDLDVYIVNSTIGYSNDVSFFNTDASGKRTYFATVPPVVASENSYTRLMYNLAEPLRLPVITIRRNMDAASFNIVKQNIIQSILALGTKGSDNEQLLCNIARKQSEILRKGNQGPLAILSLADEDIEVNSTCQLSTESTYLLESKQTTTTCTSSTCDVSVYNTHRNYARYNFESWSAPTFDNPSGSYIDTFAINYSCLMESLCPSGASSAVCNADIYNDIIADPRYSDVRNCKVTTLLNPSVASLTASDFSNPSDFNASKDYCIGTHLFKGQTKQMTLIDYFIMRDPTRKLLPTCSKSENLNFQTSLAWNDGIHIRNHLDTKEPATGFVKWVDDTVGRDNIFLAAIFKKAGDTCHGTVGSGFQMILNALGAQRTASGSICNTENYANALSGISRYVSQKALVQYVLDLSPGAEVLEVKIYDKDNNIVRELSVGTGFSVEPVIGTNKIRVTFPEGTIQPDNRLDFWIRKSI